MSPVSRALLLVACVGVSFIPGLVGARFEPGAWYAALDMPPATPPAWVFPIVWPVLYAAMGVALYLVLTAARPVPAAPLALFAGQLVLNGAWSWLFFGLRRPDLALIDIVLLLAAVIATTALFWRRRRGAGALLLPYLLWVGYATYLNAAIWWLNP